MYNKKAIAEALANLNKAKAPKQQPDIIYSENGQWDHPGEVTRVPSENITMQGVHTPLLGVDNLGNQQMMYPGGEYTFPGADYVDEYPMAKYGGLVTGLTNTQGNLLMNKKGKRMMAQSGSLSATNELFLGNPLTTKRKKAVFVPKYDFKEGGEDPDNKSNNNASVSTSKVTAGDMGKIYLEKLAKSKELEDKLNLEKEAVEKKRQELLKRAQLKAEAQDPSTRTDLGWIKTGPFFCNSHNCELMGDAGYRVPEGAKPFTIGLVTYEPGDKFPLIPGNIEMKGYAENLGWVPISKEEAQPGDWAQEEIYKDSDYQGNEFKEKRFIPAHSMIVGPDGKYYNAVSGRRDRYDLTNVGYEPETENKTWRNVHYRYVGSMPYYEQQLEELKKDLTTYSKYYNEPVDSLQMKQAKPIATTFKKEFNPIPTPEETYNKQLESIDSSDQSKFSKILARRKAAQNFADLQKYENFLKGKNENYLLTGKQTGGFIDLELTSEEIEEYKKGGYIVEEL
jgi:hypothetical protein